VSLRAVGEKTKPSFKAGKEMLRSIAAADQRQSIRPNRGSLGRRFTARDGAGALPRLCVVGDAREPVAQLDRSRQLTALLVDGADRSGIRLGDDEHRRSMGTESLADNAIRIESTVHWSNESCHSDFVNGQPLGFASYHSD
jgi:hypothetical protein